MIAPCKNCPDRHLHCHSECEKYKLFVVENEKKKAQIYKEYKLNEGYIDNIIGLKKRKKNNRVRRNRK